MGRCKRCGERSVVLDPSTSVRVCSSCGAEQSADNFQSQAFASDGRALGSIVRSVGEYTRRDRKIYLAGAQIADLTSKLGLSAARAADVHAMVADITDGEFGEGEWFPVFVGACACVIMRRNGHPLAINEAAATVGCGVHELGRMVVRVSQFLGLAGLPEFDIVQSLERAVRTCPSLVGVEEEKAEEMTRQGKFLLHCVVKWSLSTGRQPLPLVAAVTSFVGEVNGVEADVNEIAKEIYAKPATSKLRKRELLETLVKAAKVLLPWGEDVTVKNVVHHAPLLFRCMEMKVKTGTLDTGQFTPRLQSTFCGFLYSEKHDSQYLNVDGGDGTDALNCKDAKKVKLSAEHLSDAYKKVLEGRDVVRPSREFEKSLARKRDRESILLQPLLDFGSKLCENLSLEQIMERDVGYDAPPPSFVAGLEARERRRERIKVAKCRISKVMNPSYADSAAEDDVLFPKRLGSKKRSRQEVLVANGIDWEDWIIELLLLHQVNEEEIEQGHYNRLLDLHVFSSTNIHE